ncbi:MAG: hypothetical protein JNM22_21855 [Saprospiraceae bacterium]|nr:hypothetical protein [Saprospiraceae bacterium]
MLNRKLLEVLQRLDASERKKLRLLLQSPYFNSAHQAESLVRLYDYIIQYDANESDPMLDKARVFHYFFPDKPFEEGQKSSLDGWMSKLFSLVRTFLAQEKMNRDPYETEYQELLSLLYFCRKYALEERFWQVAQTLKKLQDERPFRDADFFHKQFKLAAEITAFKTLTNSFQDDANIVSTSVYLDTYYSILHLEMACALQYQHQLSQNDEELDYRQIDIALTLARNGGFVHLPLIELYQLVYSLLQSPDNQEAHHSFETLLEQHKHGIPPEILSNLKAYQRHFWVRYYTRSGNPFFRTKLFDLYKEHFEQGYFYIEGSITVQALRMLTIFALKLGHFDWAKQVLDQHPPTRICGTRYPVEAHNLNLAEYHFYKKEYAQAVEKLQYRLFENPHFSILVDVLLIKIYVETQDDLLDSRMKALEQKVRRTKLSAESKARYNNFLKKLDKITRLGWQKGNSRLDKVKHEIQSVPHIIEREWLLGKLS